MKVWLNGLVVDAADARVAYNDHGITVGDGVFETLKTYRGRPFAVTRHLERLHASAAGLGLACPSDDVLRGAIDAVCLANDVEDAAIRITITAGPGPLGSARGTAGPTAIVATAPLTQWPDATDVAVVPWPRNERGATAGLKTTSYAENVVALAYARERGATEAIFVNTAGELCEGTGSNVFVALGGRLLTPPLSSGCLAGVTRGLLVEAGLAEERAMTVDDLRRCDEAFLTSTTREVQPISSVDGEALRETGGPLTSQAAQAFAALVERDIDP